MDWKEYEEITKHIYETLGNETGVSILCFGKECKVKGKSNVNHQIDVLAKHSDGLHSYKTAIECKYWEENISKDIIMKVAEIVEDAGLNKGVIVSKNGFTPDAISFAQYRNIGLVELREMTEKDWEGRVQNINIELQMLNPIITKMDLIPTEENKSESAKLTLNTDFIEIKVNGKSEKFKKYLLDFNSELFKKNENEELIKGYNFEGDAKFIDTFNGQEIPIKGFTLFGVLKIGKSLIEIKGKDHIWLIMKSIFEDKTFTISRDKKIKERK